jgi:hypothetical protein
MTGGDLSVFRKALELTPEIHMLEAVDAMSIEDLQRALAVINSPEFGKFTYLKPRIEALLQGKCDLRSWEKADRALALAEENNRLVRRSLMLSYISLALSIVALAVAVLK